MSQIDPQAWDQALISLHDMGWKILSHNRETGVVTVCLPQVRS